MVILRYGHYSALRDEKVKLPYLGKGSTNSHEIWYDDALFVQIQYGARPPS